MIWSPDVPVFRNDAGELLPQPYKLSIVTSPAVNLGAIRNGNPAEAALIEGAMLRRMDYVLALFASQGVRQLLLGAWGCGVFQNDPRKIAAWFATYLKGNGKYAQAFDRVVFAVLDRSKNQDNIQAFTRHFS